MVLAEGDSLGVDEFPQIAAQIAAHGSGEGGEPTSDIEPLDPWLGELDLAPEQFEDHALAPSPEAMPVAAALWLAICTMRGSSLARIDHLSRDFGRYATTRDLNELL